MPLLHIAVHTPAHSAISAASELLSYRSEQLLPRGSLVRVPLGKREVLGVVWGEDTDYAGEASALKSVAAVLEGIAALPESWLRLVQFAARYYQRSLGEMAITALPPALRDLTTEQLTRRLKRKSQVQPESTTADTALALNPEQAAVCAQISTNEGPFLLFGSTGSGKTEVYLHQAAQLLQRDPTAQVLVMVPEINLTPQLEARFQARFTTQLGQGSVVSMHSGMTPPQRLKSWLAAHTGQARIVLGTRMAVFASMPQLQLIIVDEEHDPSYKQQEGARYSARDLAIWRGHDLGAKVILGSATPSLESWWASRPAGTAGPQDGGGRYLRLVMPSRIGAAGIGAAGIGAAGIGATGAVATGSAAGAMPRLRMVDMRQQPRRTVFSEALLQAITERVERGEQALILLNRRGFAPVLFCGDCGWKSDCPHCSAHQVFHKNDRTLRCHHCGYTQRVPHACPSCGNPDILPLGKGTEQLEEELERLLRNVQRPDGDPARIARIDADTTRAKGALEEKLAHMHAGDVDVLVGTQMVAKGHDFRRVTLVAAVQPDGALMSSDFRAPERLFSLLLQAAGRAGRDAAYVAAQGSKVEMWLQTLQPDHAVYQALRRWDYAGFAAQQLAERRDAAMPPFAHQAIIRADARTQEVAQGFLRAAAAAAASQPLPGADDVFVYPPIPLAVQRVANIERAQMLIESPSRKALQQFLRAWQPTLHWLRSHPEHKALVRWLVDVDPQAI
ncbi:primosomal protein N' (replication factor Y) [Comamonas odontotermitis]|uniref:Replication restart protein PriA n=1 Tax=Comamonas odontotermitis TaxID=379895 RepID=A0ABR6RCB5_9BURK|nr:primosomal protein N' [Comamonas odontotermitis]MBB6576779.1 primosomal protein N' (replication factor Y) [Comamonas odontotermitis]